jgi:PAS domain-containing protein
MNLSPATLVSPVETADQPRPKPLPEETSKRGWNFSSLGLVIALAVLLVAIRLANFQSPRVTLALWISLISAVLAFALLSVGAIRQLRWRERQAKTVIEDREREFHEMADNIQEIFWVIDAETKKATYVNPAYQIITGRFSRSLLENLLPTKRSSILTTELLCWPSWRKRPAAGALTRGFALSNWTVRSAGFGYAAFRAAGFRVHFPHATARLWTPDPTSPPTYIWHETGFD